MIGVLQASCSSSLPLFLLYSIAVKCHLFRYDYPLRWEVDTYTRFYLTTIHTSTQPALSDYYLEIHEKHFLIATPPVRFSLSSFRLFLLHMQCIPESVK